jgi:hypothetical protein
MSATKSQQEWTADTVYHLLMTQEDDHLANEAVASAHNAAIKPLVDALRPFANAAKEATSFRSVDSKDIFVWKPTNNKRATDGITVQDLLNASNALAKAKE